LYDNYQEKWFKTPIAEDSFEAQLLAKNKDYLFIDSNQEAMKQPLNSRLLSFVDFYEGRVDQLHDGYIFLKDATFDQRKSFKCDDVGRGRCRTFRYSCRKSEKTNSYINRFNGRNLCSFCRSNRVCRFNRSLYFTPALSVQLPS